MLLTTEERNRFADYLERDAESSDLIAAELDKMTIGIVLASKIRGEAKAARIVAAKLRSLTSESLANAPAGRRDR